jgi:hypothetical protein
MHEHMQATGDIEEGIVNELLAALDPNYITYDPQPRQLAVIFEQLRNAQEYFATESQYASAEVAMLTGQRFVNRINECFKELGKKQKLLGEAATLSGTGVLCPHLSINYLTGDTSISHSVPVDEEGVFDLQTQDVVGRFRGLGFMVRNKYADEAGLMMADDNVVDPGDSYFIRLYYQLETGVYQHPLGKSALYTLGEVGVASLAFEEDSEREAAYEALTQLLSNDSQEIAELVNDLNQVLTNPNHTAKHIRKIGNIVQDLHACDALRQQDSEAILDLITTYIPPQAAYRIHVADVLEYENETESGKMSRSLVRASNGVPVEFEEYVSNIILSPGYEPEVDLQNPQVLKARGVVPYFVFEKDGSVIHAPMQRVTSFGDVS